MNPPGHKDPVPTDPGTSRSKTVLTHDPRTSINSSRTGLRTHRLAGGINEPISWLNLQLSAGRGGHRVHREKNDHAGEDTFTVNVSAIKEPRPKSAR